MWKQQSLQIDSVFQKAFDTTSMKDAHSEAGTGRGGLSFSYNLMWRNIQIWLVRATQIFLASSLKNFSRYALKRIVYVLLCPSILDPNLLFSKIIYL